jgi:hypothetical protein
MISKTIRSILVCLIGVALANITAAAPAQQPDDPLADLDLTPEQVTKLTDLTAAFTRRQIQTVSDIAGQLAELEAELERPERFETKGKARQAAKRANAIVKQIASLYGDLFTTRVEYALAAKDVLTQKQKLQLLAGLDFHVELPNDLTFYDDFNLLRDELDLTQKQAKKILRHRMNRRVNDLKLELEIDYKLLELEEEFTESEIDSGAVNKIIMDMADIATEMLDNRIDHFLKAKDELTVVQKKHLLGMLTATN